MVIALRVIDHVPPLKPHVSMVLRRRSQLGPRLLAPAPI